MQVHVKRLLLVGGVLAVAGVFMLTTFASAQSGHVQLVRWDIISLGFTPLTANTGGFAEAKTPAPENGTIRLTGSGTFVAPSGNKVGSTEVTGGGEWTVYNAAGAAVAHGNYRVKELVSWEFANFSFPPPVIIDNFGDPDERANGTAVLRIKFSDGQLGILTVGCHGPGSPDGIFEGIATTKGFKTYYDVQAPVGGVDANRTLFHVRG